MAFNKVEKISSKKIVSKGVKLKSIQFLINSSIWKHFLENSDIVLEIDNRWC